MIQAFSSFFKTFNSLLPKGVFLLVFSILVQCFTIVSITITSIEVLGKDLFLIIFLSMFIMSTILVTTIFLVIIQKNIGITLSRIYSIILFIAVFISLVYAWNENKAFLITFNSIALITSFCILILYHSSFLSLYIKNARKIREELWGIKD
ncbi:hypothetical protein CP965_08575 [Halarcobacter mediterraneus]|uniref:Uncharacterized protein n=1 Tax=Halarcobacter mediterraneus TaxID=2023153 RepID=A0A4Q1ASG8_9BACT|nr:hypothetical protein [Halarcobacter mediterraneus]RXK12623.1 hypothetical protein CP965_08575 [Halarcobacter mediterraneus]